MHQKRKIYIILLLIVIIFLSTVSSIKFNTVNFLKTGSALIKITSNDEAVIIVQEHPKVYLSSPKDAMNLLKKFMTEKGYDELPSERLSSTLVFENENRKIYVQFYLNKYYSLWEVNED